MDVTGWYNAMLKAIVILLLIGCFPLDLPAEAQETANRILFVCTGNYYRSRFAETYFNWRAGNSALPWRAVSRGFRPEPLRKGMSPLALQQLELRGVRVGPVADPQQLAEQDLTTSDYVVLLDENEHRPMMERQFPGVKPRNLHYWHIRDYPSMQAADACAAMASKIDALVKLLHN